MTISDTKVTLRLFGKELIPEEVTRLLICVPTRSAFTGQEIIKKNGKKKTITEGYWHYIYESNEPMEFEDRIRATLNSVTGDIEVWNKLSQNCRIDLFCGLFMTSYNDWFKLPVTLLKDLAMKGIELNFDIYSAD